MGYGRLSSYLLHKLVGASAGAAPVDPLWARPAWFGLFYDDPLLAADPLAVEVIGGSYHRPAITWSGFGTTGLVNAGDVLFLAIPAGAHVTSIGVMDASVNGNLLGADNLDSPLSFPSGGSWVMPAGEFFFGFDLPGTVLAGPDTLGADTWPAAGVEEFLGVEYLGG